MGGIGSGDKPTFARHTDDILMSLEIINQSIEGVEAVITRLTRERDQLQKQSYVLQKLLRADAQDHDTQVGRGTPLCRKGCRHDPSVKALRQLADLPPAA